MNTDFEFITIPRQMTAPKLSNDHIYCSDKFDHTMACTDLWCDDRACALIKSHFYHYRLHENGHTGHSSSCKTCKVFEIYMSQHIVICTNLSCSIKYCKNYKNIAPLPLRDDSLGERDGLSIIKEMPGNTLDKANLSEVLLLKKRKL
jgi:hypothetical protein